MFTTIDLYKQ